MIGTLHIAGCFRAMNARHYREVVTQAIGSLLAHRFRAALTDTSVPLDLASGFAPATFEEWRQLVDKATTYIGSDQSIRIGDPIDRQDLIDTPVSDRFLRHAENHAARLVLGNRDRARALERIGMRNSRPRRWRTAQPAT